MKKGDIAIQYVFLIFIAVIAVFVVVGMLANWKLGAEKFMDILTGKKPSNIQDKETITAIGKPAYINEVVKQSKICFDQKRQNPGASGELCYTVKCCDNNNPGCPQSTCNAGCSDVKTTIEQSLGVAIYCDEFAASNKAIIAYDFSKNTVVIR